MGTKGINIVDIIVLIIMLLSIISAYKMGFTKLLLQKFSFIGGVVGASILTPPVSNIVADIFDIQGKIIRFVTEHINDAKLFATNSDLSVEKGLANLNNLLDDMSILGNFTAKALKELDVVSLIGEGYYKDELIKMIVDAVQVPVMTIVNGIVFFALLLACMFIFSLLTGVINSVVSVIPFLGLANNLLGGLLGVVNGVLWGVLFIIVYLLISLFVTDVSFISFDLVKSSVLGDIVLGVFNNIGLK